MADSSVYDEYTLAGLNQAKGLLGKETSTYPAYVPSQAQSPAALDYYSYTPTSPMSSLNAPNYTIKSQAAQPWTQWTPSASPTYGTANTAAVASPYSWQDTALSAQNVNSQNAQTAGYNWNQWTPGQNSQYQSVNTNVNASPFSYQTIDPTAKTAAYSWQNYGQNAPTYQGLMSGDYDALQQALTTPGQIAAQNAYNTASQQLNSAMTGRGLYGSSIMANQANQGANREYMNALSSNAANAAAQRYGLQQTDLANASAQELAAWQGRLNESNLANQAGLDYSKLATNTNLQNAANLLSQSQAQNAAGLDYSKLQTQTASDSAARALQQQQNLNALQSSDYQTMQGLLANQNIAANQAGLDYAGLQTNTNLQNAANNLAAQQSNQAANTQLQQLLAQQGLAKNQAGLDYANLTTGVNQQNVANALAQQQQLNALRSSDTQNLQGLLANQNTQQNAYNQAARAQDLTQENQLNQYNAQMFQLGEQQNKDLFTANLAAAEDQNTYAANKTAWDQQNATNLRNWQNQQPYEQYLYNQAAGAYANQSDEALYNRALALGGLGNTSSTAASNYQLAQQQLAAQQQAAANATSTANTSAYLGALGLLGGGLLSNTNLFW